MLNIVSGDRRTCKKFVPYIYLILQLIGLALVLYMAFETSAYDIKVVMITSIIAFFFSRKYFKKTKYILERCEGGHAIRIA